MSRLNTRHWLVGSKPWSGALEWFARFAGFAGVIGVLNSKYTCDIYTHWLAA